jgi:glycine cleavage system aminomethyltransferase T
VPDLFHVDGVAKIRCFGRPEALDALARPEGTLAGRIAPDELVVVGAPGTAAALLQTLTAALADEGAAALVVDHTDGWTFFSITGERAGEVFARVSHIPLPDGDGPTFFMGRVCDVACKAFHRPGRIDLMCGAETAHHVEHRLEAVGEALGLRHAAVPADDPVGLGVGAVAL